MWQISACVKKCCLHKNMLDLHILVWSRCLTFFCNFKRLRPTPRRSPRLHELKITFDMWVHVLGHAYVLHKVCSDSTIENIACLLRTYKNDKIMYNSAKGLYCLEKCKNQVVRLKFPKDCRLAKAVWRNFTSCMPHSNPWKVFRYYCFLPKYLSCGTP